MTITREQVADLQPGDVVELGFSSGAIVRGPLVEDRNMGGLSIAGAGWSVRQRDGELAYGLERNAATLTVVSRAPRLATAEEIAAELYELVEDLCQVANDIADDAQAELTIHIAARIRRNTSLLVDGETGQVVP